MAPERVTWPEALAWRLGRQHLDPIGAGSVTDVVERLCGVQAQVASSAELAVRVRRQDSAAGEVAAALADGRLVKTWAMRGTLHVFRAEDAGTFLSLMASGRSWERPSWTSHFGVDPAGIERMRVAIREILMGRVLTRAELVAEVTSRPGLEHVGDALRSGWGTLLKPVAWQGDLCFGPNRGTQVTFTHPTSASDRWIAPPDPEVAAPRAIEAYLGAYGPAGASAFSTWLSGGWFGKRRLAAWFGALGDRVVEVDLEGDAAFVLAEHLDELRATEPTKVVRLLPGFDQYVLGPGTSDGHVTPTARRTAVSRQSGWISPVVVTGGVVTGTWGLDGDELAIAWFGEAGRPPRRLLDAEIARLASIVGRDLRPTITVD